MFAGSGGEKGEDGEGKREDGEGKRGERREGRSGGIWERVGRNRGGRRGKIN